MKSRKLLLSTTRILVIGYILICMSLFFFQEKFIFFPEKLDRDFIFRFDQRFDEIRIPMKDGKLLHGLLFKADPSKGLIFYLHGNAGSVNSWGHVAKRYTELSYDVFVLDYRGYGKSEGSISGQQQFFEDVQTAYDEMKKRYVESEIIVMGYSIGTGPATYLASTNQPGLLVLQAPYYSLVDMMRRNYPILPTFLLKYKFETNKYIKDCQMPVAIFHGDQDEVIYYKSSLKLKPLLKESDTLITPRGQGHNGMTDNVDYIDSIAKILR
jgi:pimeloyl-ACP methyl ester carboxylesterase